MVNDNTPPKRLEDPQVLLSILDNLPTSIFVKDEDLNFVYSNALHCKLIERSEAELLGKSDREFWPAETVKGFEEHDRSVIDSGQGMTEEVLQRCRELFFTTKRTGTGIGLALCARLVEEAGGTLHIESTFGRGTHIAISIPLGGEFHRNP